MRSRIQELKPDALLVNPVSNATLPYGHFVQPKTGRSMHVPAASKGAKVYFEKHIPAFNELPRLVSPAYHLQFSEALSNFALRCARPIVESFKGRLIYAGGDDVLAMLPADQALDCAEALRVAFRGDPSPLHIRPEGQRDAFQQAEIPASISLANPAGPECPGFMVEDRRCDQLGTPIPFIVHGPQTDVSVGIAIAHFKQPLQQVVREAQAAEKRAKKEHGRSAVAFTLIKRSGETIHQIGASTWPRHQPV